MPPTPPAAAESPPKRPELLGSIRSLPAGKSGFTDPWCLVEGLNQVVPVAPNPDDPETLKPPPDPRSGATYIWPAGNVYDAVNGDHTMPISKDENGTTIVDLTGMTLANPLREESPGSLQQNGYMPCIVKGLTDALKPPPAVTAAPASPVDPPPPSDPPPADPPPASSAPTKPPLAGAAAKAKP